MGPAVKIPSRKCHIWNRRPWFAYHYATFMGLRWRLKVVYSWAPPLLRVFGCNKTVPFWAEIWRFWGIIRGLTLNLSFITPKRHISLRDFTFMELSRVKIHQPVWPLRESIEKKVCYRKKAQKRYISPICPEIPNGWICTKFGLGIESSREHNQWCGILWQSAQGLRFCMGSKFAISHWLGLSQLTQCWR